MDNASPSPPKRPRTIDFLTSQLGKPVRYFPFNRKSAANSQQDKSTKTNRTPTAKGQHIVTSTLPVIPYSSTMKFVPNKEANISNKLQKLKLKSPDGRDLGEINVQLLPQKGDGIGGKTIMLQKHSLFGKLDNPSAVSILKPVEKNKHTTTVNGTISVRQTTTVHSNFVNSGTNSVSVNAIRSINTVKEIGNTKPVLKPKIEHHHSPLILRHSDIPKYSPGSSGSKVYLINVDKQASLNKVKPVNNEPRNLAPNQKIIVVHAENYPDSTEGKKNNSPTMATESRTNLSSKDESSTELATSTSNVRTIPSVFWNPSKFSDLQSKLSHQKSRANDNETVKIGSNVGGDKSMMIVTQSLDSEQVKSASKSITLGTSALYKKHNAKLNSWTIVKTSGKKLEHSRQSSGCEGDGKESPKNSAEMSRVSQTPIVSVNNTNCENSQNVTSTTSNITHTVGGKQLSDNVEGNTQHENIEDKSSSDQNLRENIMVILHGDMNTLKNSDKKDSEGKVASNKATCMEVDAGTEEISVAMNTENLNRGLTQADDSSKKKVNNSTSDQQDFDIIQKALSSCTDQDLRNKALKALADCGIGVKRDVPVSPTVSVSDSVTQTKIFSLFKPEMLVEYSDDCPTFNKLNVIISNDKLPLHPQEILPCNEMDCYNLPANPLLSNETFLPDEISNILDEYILDESRQEVNQMKDIFAKPSPVVSQAFDQIKKDFEAATTIDSNGMMGIHRAVLSGNIKEVQRQLIVLKAVKESIEVPTDDGKTSLELAVLHDLDLAIVQTLLAAGAKPAFQIKLHESALIIASKTSSVALPELIKHVTPSSLLDIMDSEGFAPLHYCAQLGNMQGVKALVAAGAFINLKDAKSGRTALFHALESRNIEMAWYLVDNGASPSIMNFAGQSPAALVDEYRHNTLAEKFNQAVR